MLQLAANNPHRAKYWGEVREEVKTELDRIKELYLAKARCVESVGRVCLWPVTGDLGMDSLQEKTTRLIKPLIPPDAEDRVSRSFKQWNQIIREHIRTSTGLKLSDKDGTWSVPVKVVDGFPIEFAKLINKYDDPVLWQLIVGQPKLGAMVEGARFLLESWEEIESWPTLPKKWKRMKRPLERTQDFAVALQQLSIAERVRKEIRKIREDLLGAYFIEQRRIELYWIPIAMVAAMTGVRLEDLTIVILTHELAHGYTHAGSDIDGRQWDTAGFAQSSIEVVEGLAQFYTHTIMQLLASRTPGPQEAFRKLLELQSKPYQVYQQWIDKQPDRTGEIIRFAMVSARNSGAVEYGDWKRAITRSASSLIRKKKSPAPSLFADQ